MKALIAFYILAIVLIAFCGLVYSYNEWMGRGLLLLMIVGYFYFIKKMEEERDEQ